MGSLVRCKACGLRCDARPIGVYWRWMLANKQWKKYYARICNACWVSKVMPLDVDYSADAELTCPQCGMKTEDDYDGIYTTSFPGPVGKLSTESPFCDADAAGYRIWVTSFADDISSLDGAPGPHRERYTPAETLRSLGRVAS